METKRERLYDYSGGIDLANFEKWLQSMPIIEPRKEVLNPVMKWMTGLKLSRK